MKKRISLFLVLLVLTVLSLPRGGAFAKELSEYYSGDYIYELMEDSSARILRWTGEDRMLFIEEELDGHPVSAIAGGAFYGSEGLTGVYLPGCVTEIGFNPFVNCPALVDIRVAAASESFAVVDRALYDKALTRLICYPQGLENSEYALPETVEAIASSAFQGCQSLVSVSLPEGLKEIGEYAFEDCTSLASLSIPSGIQTVAPTAFVGCDQMELRLAVGDAVYRPSLIGEAAPGSAFPSDSSEYTLLWPGDSGAAVRRLQERLRELGHYAGEPTGSYNNATIEAVRSFQESVGVNATGSASPALQEMLFAGAEDPGEETSSGDAAVALSDLFLSGLLQGEEDAPAGNDEPGEEAAEDAEKAAEREAELPAESAATGPEGHIVVDVASEIRLGPGISFESAASLRPGQEMEYLGAQSSDKYGAVWYCAAYRGITGWIPADCVHFEEGEISAVLPEIPEDSISRYTGIFRLESSSHKRNNPVPVDASRAMDGNFKTVWCTDNHIADEWVRISVGDGRQYQIAGVRIASGFWETSDLFMKNCAPRHVDIYCDGLYVTSAVLEKVRDYQTIWFAGPVSCSSLQLIMRDGYIYKQGDYDCCIAEIEMLGPGAEHLLSQTLPDWGTAVSAAASHVTSGGRIARGDYNMSVLGLQVLLREGFGMLSGAADGSFGVGTQQAVEALAARMRAVLPQCEAMAPGVVDAAYWRNMLAYMDMIWQGE